MPLKFYNSLTRNKEIFEPIQAPFVGMYVCGPTVSGESHLGHARPFICFDIIYRYLLFLGYKVRYVRNITDAGHFEEEGREAEDKISSKALLEKLEPMELVQKYTNLFHQAMLAFNNLQPNIEPTATGHIVEQIEMIKKIIAEGYGYIVNGSVYFDVMKYHIDFSAKDLPYGILSGRIIEDQLNNSRSLVQQEEKRNPNDFALWKKAPDNHIMRWASPWSDGFPGWHVECSAMSSKYLGKFFDIHGGGMDLQFPHHECEIAQSTVCNHQSPSKYWIHNNMITINGKKMGKSYNNVIKLSELFAGTNPILSQPYHPMTIRFFIIQSHYRGTLDFSNEALQAADKALKRLWDAYSWFINFDYPAKKIDVIEDDTIDKNINALIDEFQPSMEDDFNTAKLVALIFEIVPILNGIKDKHIPYKGLSLDTVKRLKKNLKIFIEDILGIQFKTKDNQIQFDGLVAILINIRKEAKQRRDFVTSDKIRKELSELGISLNDDKDGETSYSF